SSSQSGYVSSRAAGRLQQPAGVEGAILAACGLDEMGLALSVYLEGNIGILRMVIPGPFQHAASCHCRRWTSNLHELHAQIRVHFGNQLIAGLGVATSDARWRHCRIRFASRRDDVWRASRDVLQTRPALRGTSVEEPAVPQAA